MTQTANDNAEVQPTRFEWLLEKLELPEEKAALKAERNHFEKMVNENEPGTTEYAHAQYSMECMNQQGKFREVSTELLRSMSWHMSSKGESFWHALYDKYYDIKFRRLRERIAKVHEEAKEGIAARKAAVVKAAEDNLKALESADATPVETNVLPVREGDDALES